MRDVDSVEPVPDIPLKWSLLLLGGFLLLFTLGFWESTVNANPVKSVALSVNDRSGGSSNGRDTSGNDWTIVPLDRKDLQSRLGAASADSVLSFYHTAHRRLWTGSGNARKRAEAWIAILMHADREGLDPGYYDVARLDRMQESLDEKDPTASMTFELALTGAVLLYAHDVARGTTAEFEPADVSAVLFALQKSNHDDADAIAEGWSPDHAQYLVLRRALEKYRSMDPELWPAPISDPGLLREGDPIPKRVLERLRVHLDWWRIEPAIGDRDGDLSELVYDSTAVAAVRAFQRSRHLDDDGVLGPETIEELNRSRDDYMVTIIANMDRWRRLPRDLGETYLHANIPSYQLHGFRDGHRDLDMRIIVGKPSWPTPTFSDTAELVVFRPHWNVPTSILEDEVLPEVIEDEAYLERNDMVVLVRQSGETLDPDEVDWESLSENDAAIESLLVQQQPGDGNPLGRMKLLFPNRHHVYLHDTSKPALFEQNRRALSHGCVRVADPVALGVFVLGTQGWSPGEVKDAMNESERKTVVLETPVPVYITYFTAAVIDGKLRFRHDIYGLDVAAPSTLSRRTLEE